MEGSSVQAVWTILSAALVVVLSYTLGSTPWGFLIARSRGMDIRQHGSGNIGATNVLRVVGKKWGILCFVLDFLKGLIPVLVVGLWLGGMLPVGSELGRLLAAAAAVCGHVWPVWLKFKGGKGVATTVGALLAVSWIAITVGALVWVVVFFATRYVSLASLCAAVMLPVGFVAAAVLRGQPVGDPALILLILLAVLVVFRHRSNVKRLIQGTEYRFERKKKVAS